MKYDNPELIEALASEYVLGTMVGAARHRFETLQRERSDIREAVWRWESRLGALCAATQPLQPPGKSWRAIENRIWPQAKSGVWHSLGFWRSWSALTSALALAVIFMVVPVTQRSGPDHIGLIGEASAPLWLISANLQTGEVSARAVNAEAADVDKVFELWMLPVSGNPISMGLLPVSGESTQRSLPAGLLALLKQSKGLAVSIEPAGGSPTGVPTGPVVHTTNILAL
ncbi:MAG: anti-sigma factor [Halioglobus sp.]